MNGLNFLCEPLTHPFMQRALLACALIGFTNGFLGAIVVLRRLALMADSLSHSLLPGLAVGVMICGLAPGGLFIGALVAAALVALGAEIVSRSSRVKVESALAVLYTTTFSAGIVLLSFAPVRVDLHSYLFGNILGVSDADLWINYTISFVTISLIAALQRPLIIMLFDPVVAATQGIPVTRLNYLMLALLVLVMISSLQAVGVILALGLLVAPAATMYLLCDSAAAMFWGGGFIGLFGSCAGLLISYWTNLPSGGCIVLLLGFIFLAAFFFSPKYGLLRRVLRRPHRHEEAAQRQHIG